MNKQFRSKQLEMTDKKLHNLSANWRNKNISSCWLSGWDSIKQAKNIMWYTTLRNSVRKITFTSCSKYATPFQITLVIDIRLLNAPFI